MTEDDHQKLIDEVTRDVTPEETREIIAFLSQIVRACQDAGAQDSDELPTFIRHLGARVRAADRLRRKLVTDTGPTPKITIFPWRRNN